MPWRPFRRLVAPAGRSFRTARCRLDRGRLGLALGEPGAAADLAAARALFRALDLADAPGEDGLAAT